MMYTPIQKYVEALLSELQHIPAERRQILDKLETYITSQSKQNKMVQLVFICTHNSRRSQFGQVWATVAASYFKKKNIHAFSAGTEVTVFHPHAIQSLQRLGFEVRNTAPVKNSPVELTFAADEKPVICFSKMVQDASNPHSSFAAIMTCSEAEANCPFVPGAGFVIATTYADPKAADDTPIQNRVYDECCRQIAREIFYVFSKLNSVSHE